MGWMKKRIGSSALNSGVRSRSLGWKIGRQKSFESECSHGMAHTKVWFTLALAILVLGNAESRAEDFGYEIRANRMEGLRGLKTSGAGLSLLSFVADHTQIPLEAKAVLTVHFYVPQNGSVYLTALELLRHDLSHYQMQPLQTEWSAGWQKFGPWPVRDVLFPLGIQPTQLGLVARLDDDRSGSGEIVPVHLSDNDSYQPSGRYLIHVLPQNSLAQATYDLISVNTGENVDSGTLQNIGARSPFSISLDLSQQPEGEYRLLIRTKELGRTTGPSRQYFFHHVRSSNR